MSADVMIDSGCAACAPVWAMRDPVMITSCTWSVGEVGACCAATGCRPSTAASVSARWKRRAVGFDDIDKLPKLISCVRKQSPRASARLLKVSFLYLSGLEPSTAGTVTAISYRARIKEPRGLRPCRHKCCRPATRRSVVVRGCQVRLAVGAAAAGKECRGGERGGRVWWSQAGSNRRPLACHASALPAELWPHAKPPHATQPPRGCQASLGRHFGEARHRCARGSAHGPRGQASHRSAGIRRFR